MSFPRYESYKDSGFEWIGDLPNDWTTDKIKFNTYVKGRVGWHGLNSNEFSDEGVHLVTGTDFDNGFVNWDLCYRITDERYSEDPYIQLKENDLLITKDGTIGKLARVKGLPERASLNSGIFLVRAKNKAYLEDFLYWVLQSSLFVHFMDLRKTGSTIQHLYQEVFNQFAFPIPSYSEQHQICIFLDRETAKIDALIAEQQRLIELLKEKRQVVISHAVTKGLNPDAPMKDSGIEWLGGVPAHWDVVKLFFLTTKVGDGLHGTPQYVDESGFRFINGNNLTNGSISITESTRCVSYEEFEKNKVTLDSNTLLMSINGTIGSVAFYQGESVILGKSAAYINCSNELSRNFLYFFLQSSSIKACFDLEITGTTIFNLSLESIRNLPIALPSLNEQSEIVSYLNIRRAEFNALLNESQLAIDLLKERRTALISAAVTGKIDVRHCQPHSDCFFASPENEAAWAESR